MDDRADREHRLADALRENLRRRKAQARARRDPAPDASPGDAPPDDDQSRAGR